MEAIAELQKTVALLVSQLQEVTARADASAAAVQTLQDAAAQTAWNRPAGAAQPARQIRLLDPKTSQPEVFEGDRRKVRGWV